MNEKVEIGDLVKYRGLETRWKFGIVVHIGDWRGHGFPKDAVWCVWDYSPEEAEKSYEESKKNRTLVPPVESPGGRLTYTNYEITVVRPRVVEKKKKRFDAVIEETTEKVKRRA